MNSDNPPPPKRYVLGLEDYWRKVMAARATRASAGHDMGGIPLTDEDRLRHVEEMVAAFRNMDGIVDCQVNNPHIRFVKDELDDEKAQMKAWELLVRRPLRIFRITHPSLSSCTLHTTGCRKLF